MNSTNCSNNKVLIFGIDGATWTVLKPAIDAGFMPALKNLIDTGASGISQSTIPALTPAAWGSFLTGTNPGKTGIFNFAYLDINTKKSCFISSRFLNNTIWKILSQAGKKVASVNVPMTYPPAKINGYLISGILTPSLDSNFTYPDSLKNELLNAVPDYQIISMSQFPNFLKLDNFEIFVNQMAANLDNRARAAQFVINKEPLDVFMVHFQASDLIQHLLWAWLDSSHPLFESEKQNYIFQNFYALLDRHIQETQQLFIQKNPGNIMTIVVSDHGFQTHTKRFNLGNWLCQNGFLKFNPRSTQIPLLKKFTRKLRLGKLFKKFFSDKTLASLEKNLKIDIDQFHWEQSSAICMGKSSEGFIYLLDKDPDKKAQIQATLIKMLNDIRDPQNHQPIIRQVHLKNDIYSGDALEFLPDLILEPNPGYTFTSAIQSGPDLFHNVHPNTDFHIGMHHRNGILIANGTGIPPQNNIQCNLWDLVPTILYYLGLPVYQNMDGRVVQEIFTEDFKNNHPPVRKIEPGEKISPADLAEYSPQDEKNIEARLKDLGYM